VQIRRDRQGCDLVTQGTAGIGTFPCPKIDRDGERCKDEVVLC
jgi:hypothetical protein